MLRIRDPVASLQFYRDVLGMTLVDRFDFPQYEFSLYFLTTLHPDDPPYALVPGTQEAHDYLWTMDGVTLELTHNHGTELEDAPTHNYHPGNEDGDGFGHVAFSCDDVYEATDKLVQQGVTFKKKPDEGVMQGLAFAYDPDGYWIEIVKRGRPAGTTAPTFNLSQTMLRVKDPKKSLEFYQRLGMTVVQEKHFPDYGFSLYFLASSANVRLLGDSSSDGDLFGPILELTHNHGTEDDETHVYYNGNEDDRQGFGHTGFLVDDVYAACDSIRTMGYGFRKEPDGGSMKGLAFAYDPDGYSIEIIKRGGIDFGDTKVVQ